VRIKYFDKRHRRIQIAVATTLLISLVTTACSLEQPGQNPVGIAPVATGAAATLNPAGDPLEPTQVANKAIHQAANAVITPSDTSASTSVEEPSSTAFVDASDNTPVADAFMLAPLAEKLTTPEAVKILTPSIVQVVTETLSMNMFNQPIPNRGVGTGIVLNTEGHVLTNNHVVDGAQRITVIFADGNSRVAEIVGRDFQTDLAVIQVEPSGLTLRPAKLGVSAELQVGEDVIAIGHALGLPGGPTVSKGVVSALGRTIDTDSSTTIVDLIQTDAEINPGNSGGALANSRAEVIGINTAIIQSGRGIGFAINIDDAKQVLTQLMNKGYVDRGFLGISPVNVTPGLASRFDLPATEGILIGRIIAGTAAADVGLQVEDIIVKLGDTPIRNTGELSKFLISHRPGETIDVVFYRNNQQMTTNLTLGGRDFE